MNRDEKRSRAKGLPPAIHKSAGRRMLYPSEPTGGTWMALNDRGISFALINWYTIAQKAGRDAVSRGRVIPLVGTANSSSAVDGCLAQMDLKRTNPFRLIAVLPYRREIMEWRWNLNQLTRHPHPWRAQQWISSGFDEPQAQKVRTATFNQALNQKRTGSPGWLRRLHRSHLPHAGPFSICMHRDDAVTVSYTEICVDHKRGVMRHSGGQACLNSGLQVFELRNTAGRFRPMPAAKILGAGSKPNSRGAGSLCFAGVAA